jgi:hypothetical protein
MWPTPDVRGFTNDGSLEMLKGLAKDREEWSAMAYRKGRKAKERLWPTPTTPTGGGERSGDRSGTGSLNYMARSGQLTGPKITGSLNPQWVAWLMGYPTEYLSCVPWATRSFRKSRKK